MTSQKSRDDEPQQFDSKICSKRQFTIDCPTLTNQESHHGTDLDNRFRTIKILDQNPKLNDHHLHNEVLHDPCEHFELTEDSIPLNDACGGESTLDVDGTAKKFIFGHNDTDPIVRAVKCQINVRKNGQLEVEVPGDPSLSQKLQNFLSNRLAQNSTFSVTNAQAAAPSNFMTFPIATMEDLEGLEAMLKIPEHRNKLSDIIQCQHRGKTGQDSMRKCLKYVLTDDVASEFDWMFVGRRREVAKRNFKDLTLVNVLIDTIMELYPSTNVHRLENAAKIWLRQSAQRQKMKNST